MVRRCGCSLVVTDGRLKERSEGPSDPSSVPTSGHSSVRMDRLGTSFLLVVLCDLRSDKDRRA